MGKNVVGLVWLAGIVLAIVVYRVGPDQILYTGVHLVDNIRLAIDNLLAALAIDTYDVMRALTLGLLPAFVVLAVLAQRGGRPVLRVVVVVAVLFLLLLYQPAREGWYVSSTRWTLAFFAVAIGCAMITRRLMEPPRDWRGPYGPRPGASDPNRVPPNGRPSGGAASTGMPPASPPWGRPSP